MNNYSNEGFISIPYDAKVLSFIPDHIQKMVTVIYQHSNYQQSIKQLKWFKIDGLIPHNHQIYDLNSPNWSEVKYGITCSFQISMTSFENFIILYQVEKTIDEIRDEKLDYLLDKS
jgi:hypothetical protein